MTSSTDFDSPLETWIDSDSPIIDHNLLDSEEPFNHRRHHPPTSITTTPTHFATNAVVVSIGSDCFDGVPNEKSSSSFSPDTFHFPAKHSQPQSVSAPPSPDLVSHSLSLSHKVPRIRTPIPITLSVSPPLSPVGSSSSSHREHGFRTASPRNKGTSNNANLRGTERSTPLTPTSTSTPTSLPAPAPTLTPTLMPTPSSVSLSTSMISSTSTTTITSISTSTSMGMSTITSTPTPATPPTPPPELSNSRARLTQSNSLGGITSTKPRVKSETKSRPLSSWINKPVEPESVVTVNDPTYYENFVFIEEVNHRAWKRRYLVTEESKLVFYTDNLKRKKKGEIEWSAISQVGIVDNYGGFYNGKKYVFMLHNSALQRTFFMCTEKQSEQQHWVNIITAKPKEKLHVSNLQSSTPPHSSTPNRDNRERERDTVGKVRGITKELTRNYSTSTKKFVVEKFIVNLPENQIKAFVYNPDVTLDSMIQKIIETREAFSYETHQVSDCEGKPLDVELTLKELRDVKEVNFIPIQGMEKIIEEKIRRRQGEQLQTVDDVHEWILGKFKNLTIADMFRDKEIDGEALFALKAEDIVNKFGFTEKKAEEMVKDIAETRKKKALKEKFVIRLPSKQMRSFFYKPEVKVSKLLDKIIETRKGFSHTTHIAIDNPKDFNPINTELTLEELELREIYFWPRPVDTPIIRVDLTNCLQVYINIPIMNNRCTIKAISLDMKLRDVIKKLNEDLPENIRSDRFALFYNGMCLIDLEAEFKSLSIGHRATLEFKRMEEYEIVIQDDQTRKRYIPHSATVGESLDDLTINFAFENEVTNTKFYTFALRYQDYQLEENKTFMHKKFKEGDIIEAVGYANRPEDKDLSKNLLITYSPWSGWQKQREPYMVKGFLKKRGVKYRAWKTRYFILEETSLRWFENETAKKHKGGLYLHQINSVHITETELTDAFYFTVTVPGREVELQAEGETKGKAWMEAINTLCRLRRAEILYESEICEDPTLVHKRSESIEISAPFNPAHRSHINLDMIWTGEEAFMFDNNLLGQGASGIVVKAKVHGGFEVAVKKVKQKDVKVQKELEREIDILKKCKHPNIVAYYGTKLTTDQVWIIMDYCGLGSVKDVMKFLNRSLTESEVQYVLKFTLIGLKYLHDIPILHLDLKAPNILMTNSGDVKLADFGVSKQLTQSGENLHATSYVGSPLFMAPEVIAKGEYNQTADIWSLGITVIEMAEFYPPNLDIQKVEDLPLIIERDPPKLQKPESWSPELNDFLATCLVKDYHQRPGCDQLLEHKFLNPPEPLPISQNPIAKLLTEIFLKKAGETRRKSAGNTLPVAQTSSV